MSTQQLTVEALELPLAQRVSLAQALWESLGVAESQKDAPPLLETALRRGGELDSGAVQCRTREEAMHAARKALECL